MVTGKVDVREKLQYKEVEETFRKDGAPTITYTYSGQPPTSSIMRHETKPICFMQAQDLCGMYLNERKESIAKVLNDPRPCSEFTDWHQGFTPKEHREMDDRKLELKRLEMQENRHNREEWARYIFLGVVTILAALIATKVI